MATMGPASLGRIKMRTHWLVGLALGLTASGCGTQCQVQLVNRVSAPNSMQDALLYSRNCHATTNIGMHVSLVPKGAPVVDARGNVFASTRPFPVAVHWNADNELVIEYVPGADEWTRLTRYRGIKVRYVERKQL